MPRQELVLFVSFTVTNYFMLEEKIIDFKNLNPTQKIRGFIPNYMNQKNYYITLNSIEFY